MKEIFLAVATLSSLGLGFGLMLAWASKKFAVEADPRVEKIVELLPGANCGACGMTGCTGFAEALLEGKALLSFCVGCSAQSKKELAAVLGISANLASLKDSQIAVIACGGGNRCKNKFDYNGLADCRIAALNLAGYKECAYACLEQGNCVEVCPFDAIKMQPEGIPKVIPELCRSCKKCVVVCPRRIIYMVERPKKVYVRCQSQEKGPQVAKKCKVGCIACGKCVKVCPVSAIILENNLAKIDYDKCIACTKCVEVCPTEVIIIL